MQEIHDKEKSYWLPDAIKPDGDKSREELILELEQLRRMMGKLEFQYQSKNGMNIELTRQDETLAGILGSVTDHINMVDEHYNVVWANDVVKQFLGSDPVGSKCFTAYRGRDTVCKSCIVSRTFADAKVHEHETKIVGDDGEERSLWCTSNVATRYPDGRPRLVVEVARDVTDREHSEDEIIKRNRELTALNSISERISRSSTLGEILNNVLDKTLEILDINSGSIYLLDKELGLLSLAFHRGPEDEEITALSPVKIGKGIVGYVAQSGQPIWIGSIHHFIHMFPPDIQEDLVRRNLKSAVFIPLEARGEVLGVMIASTEGDRMFTSEERELLLTIGHQISTALDNIYLLEDASRTKALEELDYLRTELLASVSHELRTPLTAIKGLADTLVQPDVEWDKETQQDFLHTINRESDILTHIVEDIMQMSQMEAGIARSTKHTCTLVEILSQLDSHLAKITPDHQFVKKIPDGLARICVDAIQISQVITNLVSNAVAYSEKGSLITLSAEAIDDQIIVSVKDEGIGISEKHIAKVFDRFFRMESGVARRRGGTGLGLAICRKIVEMHKGMIWVESKRRKGSKFSFSLPTYKESAQTDSSVSI